MPKVKSLSTQDVLLVHEILVRDFARSADPISPPGVRDIGLLESAIHRQHVSFAGHQKYSSALDSAATLAFGICNNHAFHNGNKRTALVSLLAHLDKNAMTLMGTRQKDLYTMIMAVANHSIAELAPKHRRRKKGIQGNPSASSHTLQNPDAEVEALARWIQQRARKPRRGEKQITYRELRRILKRFDYELQFPGSARGNHLDVMKLGKKTVGVLRKRTQATKKRIGSIGYKDEGTFLVLSDIKKVRHLCKLRPEDGIDSAAFYDDEAVIESFVNQYRGVLKRLARK